MAIKISGSTIIDDSRNIVNAGVTTVGVLTGTDARFSGTVEGNEYLGSGTKLTGIVTSIVAGANISVDQSTGQVTVTGLANTSNVISDTINTGSLNVTGLSTFAGLVDINAGGQANTFKVEDLTDNCVVVAGTGGELEDSANLTFDGTTLAVTGNETISGTLDVDGQTDLDVLNVAELATFTDNIVANGNIVGDNSTNISGINSVTATSYFGDGSNLTNIISGVGVQTSGGYIGAGVTTLDFRGNGLSTVTEPSSGFSTVFVDFNGQGAIWSKNESNFTASEGQTTFTKTYNPGNVDVYLNGVRQISGDNYTATNGTSVGLTTAANVGDKVDIIAYNTTGAQAISLSRTVGLVTATANQTAFTVPSYDLGNSSLDVYLNGIKLEPTEYTETDGTTITLASGAKVGDILQAFSYDVSGGNYWQLNGNVLHRSPLYNSPVGIGTNKQTDEKADLTLGQLGVGSTSLVVHGQAIFKGNVSVAGTLTSENKTNIDSLGIITARTGVDVDAGGINIDAGGLNVTAGIVTVNDYIQHSGDTNTAIRFPAADTITAETGGLERFRIASDGTTTLTGDSDGVLELNTTDTRGAMIRFQQNETSKCFIGCAEGLITGTDQDDLGIRSVDNVIFAVGGNTETARMDASGNFGIGSDDPTSDGWSVSNRLVLKSTGNAGMTLLAGSTTSSNNIIFSDTPGGLRGALGYDHSNDSYAIAVNGGVKTTINSSGDFMIGKTNNSTTVAGTVIYSSGGGGFTRTSGVPGTFNRLGTDGVLVNLVAQSIIEGTISVSGSTVSYNGAHLSRWSQLPGGADRVEILRGSVLSNLDEMCEWRYEAQPEELYEQRDIIPEGFSIGDVKTPAQDAGVEHNEQLNRMKVSDVEGDRNVSGVFQSWDDDDGTYVNDFYCAMTGDFIIRIAQGVTVERGDLLMSAGDGTAKPQEDDIVRSKTIAKVTSTNVSTTYSDGSYCVPCVLMAC